MENSNDHLHFGGPLVCFNTLQVNHALGMIPMDTRKLYLEFDEEVSIIDHTSCENLIHFGEEFEYSGRGEVEFVGMDVLTRLSTHASCTRMSTFCHRLCKKWRARVRRPPVFFT